MSNPEVCQCGTCGYEWKHGTHGGHSCTDTLSAKISALESERDALQAWKDDAEKHEFTDAELTAIYNKANGIGTGKNPPISTKFIFAAMRAIPSAPAKEGYVLISEKLVLFLNGESPLEGKWFREMNHPEAGKFWWRKYLPKTDAPKEK